MENTQTIDEFIAKLDGEKREWCEFFAKFMRDNHPEIVGKISYGVPIYKIGANDVGFWPAKNHFAFHSTDYEILNNLRPKFGGESKANIDVPYTAIDLRKVLTDAIDQIVLRNNIWAKLSAPAQRALSNAKIYRVTDLAKWRESEVLALHGVGETTLPILYGILLDNDLQFKTERK